MAGKLGFFLNFLDCMGFCRGMIAWQENFWAENGKILYQFFSLNWEKIHRKLATGWVAIKSLFSFKKYNPCKIFMSFFLCQTSPLKEWKIPSKSFWLSCLKNLSFADTGMKEKRNSKRNQQVMIKVWNGNVIDWDKRRREREKRLRTKSQAQKEREAKQEEGKGSSLISNNGNVVDKNRLTVNRTHYKRFEVLPGWYLSEHTWEKNIFQVKSINVMPT